MGFMSPVFVNTGAGAAVDGNTAGRVDVGPFTVTGVNWTPGTDLWLRWTDLSHPGNDHGLAIDDLAFTAVAVPEPSFGGLLAVGVFGLVRQRCR